MATRNIDDWRRASKSLQKELQLQAGKVSKAGELVMLKAAEDFLRDAESRPKILVPYYTGNLMDSIGVRLLNANRLIGYRTMVETTQQHAVKPQHMKGREGDIWGDVELMQRLLRPSRRSSTGLVGQMMVGVPYAGNVGGQDSEEGGFEATYFQELSELFVRKMELYLNMLEKYPKLSAVGDVQRMGLI